MRGSLSGRPLWLYGKGKLGEMAQTFFRDVGGDVAGSFEYDEPAPLDAQVAVCIVTAPYRPIERSLRERGFDNVAPFYDLAYSVRGTHPLENGWIAPPVSERDLRKINHVTSRWDDETSKVHHSLFLDWRIAREEPNCKILVSNEQHFIPEVVRVLHDHEVFLDGGAHHGKIAARFADLAPGFKKIFAVEPDKKNRAKLFNPRLIDKRIVVGDFALSDKNQDGVPFAEGYGLCSKLMPSAWSRKTTRKIDSLGIEPTWIKLHLEGGELAALRGATETLTKYRPIVTVNVDHNSDGLWRTAHYLMKLLKGYRFLFRNHVWCGAGAIIYAIPGERGG